jgi:hypothetical protein
MWHIWLCIFSSLFVDSARERDRERRKNVIKINSNDKSNEAKGEEGTNSTLPTRNINYKEGMPADMRLRARLAPLLLLIARCFTSCKGEESKWK